MLRLIHEASVIAAAGDTDRVIDCDNFEAVGERLDHWLQHVGKAVLLRLLGVGAGPDECVSRVRPAVHRIIRSHGETEVMYGDKTQTISHVHSKQVIFRQHRGEHFRSKKRSAPD